MLTVCRMKVVWFLVIHGMIKLVYSWDYRPSAGYYASSQGQHFRVPRAYASSFNFGQDLFNSNQNFVSELSNQNPGFKRLFDGIESALGSLPSSFPDTYFSDMRTQPGARISTEESLPNDFQWDFPKLSKPSEADSNSWLRNSFPFLDLNFPMPSARIGDSKGTMHYESHSSSSSSSFENLNGKKKVFKKQGSDNRVLSGEVAKNGSVSGNVERKTAGGVVSMSQSKTGKVSGVVGNMSSSVAGNLTGDSSQAENISMKDITGEAKENFVPIKPKKA